MSWVEVIRAALPGGGVFRRESADAEHLALAAAWLLEAQRAAGGGGYAHSYHLLSGWRSAYPETTGYILPTLDRLGCRLDDAVLRHSAARAHAWLLTTQQPDGSFLDLQRQAQVFDTGQILIGLNYAVEQRPELGGRDQLQRAAFWLASMQEADGSFIRHAYNRRPHSYYARVGAALIAAGRILGDDRVRAAGVRNLHWCLEQQLPNGFFRHLSFDDGPAYLHTMIYVIEGLLDGYAETGDQKMQKAAIRFARALFGASSTRDGIPRSQYRPDFSVANREFCLVGLAQWAAVCFRLATFGFDPFVFEGRRILGVLKRRQLRCADSRLNGGLFGSAPLWGRYMRLAIPNWGLKFFIDAMLEQDVRQPASA